MKLIINKSKFNEFLNIASLISDNNINPLLENIYLNAIDNKLICVFSNENISIKYIIDEEIEIINEGWLFIKYKTFKGIISKLNNKKINIEKIDNSLKISNDNFDANINIINFNETLNVDFNINDEIEFKISFKNLKEIEKKLFHSLISKEEKTSIANGICFDQQEDNLNVISTNGYKISQLKFSSNCNKKFRFVIDPDFIKLINKCNFKEDEEITFISDNNKIILKTNNLLIISKLLLGNFPNTYNAFNIEINNKFKINSKNFLELIEHGIYIVNIEKMPSVSIKVNNNYLEAKFNSIEIGNSIEKTDITNFEGNNNEISFCVNAKFLSSLLKVFDNCEIEILFSDKNHQIIFKDIQNQNFDQLILPIRN